MGVVNEGEGQHIPTKEEQEADLEKRRNELSDQQELHRKMRKGETAEYQRKPFEIKKEQEGQQQEGQQQEGQQQEGQQQEPIASTQEQESQR